MAEYIERGSLLADISVAMDYRGMGVVVGQTLMRFVKRQPAVDVVPVVRCKDCKYNQGAAKCLQPGSIIKIPADDDYCSYGERRAGGVDDGGK